MSQYTDLVPIEVIAKRMRMSHKRTQNMLTRALYKLRHVVGTDPDGDKLRNLFMEHVRLTEDRMQSLPDWEIRQ